MNWISLVLYLGLLVFLFLLKGRPKMFLFQLRAMIVSLVVYSFIRTCGGIITVGISPIDSIFAYFHCHIWASYYLAVVAYTTAMLILNFTVGNRAIQMVCRYQYSFSTSAFANLAYLVGLGLVSIVCLLPHAFFVKFDGENCICLDTSISYEALVSLYTENFVRFGLTAVISVIILSISCYKIIYWVRNTPTEQLSDTWNLLSLPGTSKEQMEAFGRPQGWMTASLCTIPLSLNFLAFSIYNTGYKFICAVGFCTVERDSRLQKIDRLLLDIQLLLFPIIITVFIPALREFPRLTCKESSLYAGDHGGDDEAGGMQPGGL